nr:UvrD-like helicase, ATP-binding domain, P-loop containing nucleoside triphosphate hydrolase [Tanacetum cinerariifolium]
MDSDAFCDFVKNELDVLCNHYNNLPELKNEPDKDEFYVDFSLVYFGVKKHNVNGNTVYLLVNMDVEWVRKWGDNGLHMDGTHPTINGRKKESLREISEFVNGQYKESPNTFTLSVKSLFKGEDITDLDSAFDKMDELLQAFVARRSGEFCYRRLCGLAEKFLASAKEFRKHYVVHSESHDAKNTKGKQGYKHQRYQVPEGLLKLS